MQYENTISIFSCHQRIWDSSRPEGWMFKQLWKTKTNPLTARDFCRFCKYSSPARWNASISAFFASSAFPPDPRRCVFTHPKKRGGKVKRTTQRSEQPWSTPRRLFICICDMLARLICGKSTAKIRRFVCPASWASKKRDEDTLRQEDRRLAYRKLRVTTYKKQLDE